MCIALCNICHKLDDVSIKLDKLGLLFVLNDLPSTLIIDKSGVPTVRYLLTLNLFLIKSI